MNSLTNNKSNSVQINELELLHSVTNTELTSYRM